MAVTISTIFVNPEVLAQQSRHAVGAIGVDGDREAACWRKIGDVDGRVVMPLGGYGVTGVFLVDLIVPETQTCRNTFDPRVEHEVRLLFAQTTPSRT